MKKWICRLLLAGVICLLFAVPVSATQQGSLLLTKTERPVTLFSVADREGLPTEAFAGLADKLTQNDLTPETAKKFYQRALQQELSGQTGIPNEHKEIIFAPIEAGWYLVCSAAEQAEFTPFLICVPMTVGEQTVYNIQAEPKTDSPAEPTVPSQPIAPKPNIPQTGAILWPKYLMLVLGIIAIGVGLFEVVRGREKSYE